MSALTQMTGYGLPQMALPSMSMPQMSRELDPLSGVVGFKPDRANRVIDVKNGDLASAVAGASYLPSGKYTSRFTDYFNTAEEKLGEDFSSIQMISDTDNTHWQNMTAGPVYLAKTKGGKSYVIEVPHSPGGGMLDWQTSSKDGWTSLGLGDLGGEGNEKLGYAAGGSMIPLSQFRGFGPNAAVVLDNINPKGASFGDSFGGLLGAGLAFALGPAGWATMPGWAAGAIGGGVGSALSGGDVIKGALFGGIGGGLGGEIGNLFSDMPGMGFIGSDFMGPLSPMESIMKGAIGGAIPGAIRGAFSGNPMMGALQGGFTGGAGTAIQGFDPTGLPALDSAIERGLIGVGGAGLFGGDMEGALLGGALNAGFAGAGEQFGIPSALTGNVSSMVNKIIRSNMSEQQKRDAIRKIQQQQQGRGMLTNRRMAG